MNQSSRRWAAVSLLSLLGAVIALWLGQRRDAAIKAAVDAAQGTTDGVVDVRSPGVAGASSPAKRSSQATGAVNRAPHRLSNTSASLDSLLKNERALLLQNALIDTALATDLPIPGNLRAGADPGSYLVQAKGPTSDAFRKALETAGAVNVAYVPNNAYLVRIDPAGADRLKADSLVAAVVPFQPYFKLERGLLAEVLSPTVPPGEARLWVTLFPGADSDARSRIESLGFKIQGEERSPFGSLVTLGGSSEQIVALARDPVVQSIEVAPQRAVLTDLARPRVGVSVDSVALTNWMGLTGSNVVVAVADSGVDATHPDLTGRVIDSGFVDSLGFSLIADKDGHGTHVAGIIATTGASFPTGTNALGSVTNANYRGMAPSASIYPLPIDLVTGSLVSDTFLQEQTARGTNRILISNNSWGYVGSSDYNSSSASFDAAVRDALPGTSGSQPLLFVFSAGNSGSGDPIDDNGGVSAVPDTIVSPATAKNVVTVGALDQPRNVTNVISFAGRTNALFAAQTDSDYQVSPYSSRGNTGIGIEGEAGRYKPDVVAPGSFVVSTRSSSYTEPTNFTSFRYTQVEGQHLEPGQTNLYAVNVPAGAIRLIIGAIPPGQTGPAIPKLIIAADPVNPPTTVRGTNRVVLEVPTDIPTGTIYYTVANTNNVGVNYDVRTAVVVGTDSGNYFTTLKQLNQPLGPYYRYESGTSMAAPVVSGTLALMQEFFESRLGQTNSPALMKALLINGARRTSEYYDFNPKGLINHQGWGVPQLTNTIPAILETEPVASWPVQMFDQSATNSLATGETFSRTVSFSAAGSTAPLKITLVWTDPPGNPLVGTKLVNDLDLIVTNSAGGSVYFGNDFPPESSYTQQAPTGIDNSDVVNNVENVYLQPPFGSNLVVTVRAKRVNVNAVTGQTNGTKQDFALVISSGDGTVSAPFTLGGSPALTTQAAPQVLTISNSVPLIGQRVGANAPMGPGGPGGGVASQWRFYVFTNDLAGATNVAFITFFPPNLSIERTNQADIDLYVSTNPGLTNLNPVALASSMKSLRRSGTESIITNNSAKGIVYYVGVKAEDQQASEFNLYAVASVEPFSQRDSEGNLIITGGRVEIADGTSANPGITLMVFPGSLEPDVIRRVLITNDFTHQNFGDLFGGLDHEGVPVVLNNHSFNGEVFQNGFRRLIYDDSGSGEFPTAIPPDGPGSLRDYWGQGAAFPWIFTIVDNSLNHTGRVERSTIKIYPRLDNTTNITVIIQPGGWYYDSYDVTPEVDRLNLIISYNGSAPGPVDTYLRADDPPTMTEYDKYANIVPPGGTNSISRGDIPPLRPATYHMGLFNPNQFPISVTYRFSVDLLLGGLFTPNPRMTNSGVILDDALTRSILTVTNSGRIVEMQVGLKAQHPRLSDLSFALVSPSGTRSLLMENRGQGTSGFAGVFTEATNLVELVRFAGIDDIIRIPMTNHLVFSDFETNALVGAVAAPGQVARWDVLSNSVAVSSNAFLRYSGSNFLALADGVIRTNFATVPGTTYTLTMGTREEPLAAWWPVDNNTWNDAVGPNLGGFISGSYGSGKVGAAAVFSGASYVRIPASPGLDVGARNGFTIEGWVNLANINSEMPLVQFQNSAATTNGVRLILNSDGAAPAAGRIAIIMVGTNGVARTNSPVAAVLGANIWQHLAWTFDNGSGASRLYVNGVQVSSNNFGALRPETRLDLYVGGRGAGGLVGSVDELAVFNNALTAPEVGAIYRAGSSGQARSAGVPSVSFGSVTKPFRSPTNVWSEFRYDFLAVSNRTSLTLTGGAWCPLVDRIALFNVTNNEVPVFGLPSGNTNSVLGVVKFAGFPVTNGLVTAADAFVFKSLVFANGFEGAPIGTYFTGQAVDIWRVVSGSVDVGSSNNFRTATGVFAVPTEGTKALDLNSLAGPGRIETATPTLVPGRLYRLRLDYSRNPGSIASGIIPQANILSGTNIFARITADQVDAGQVMPWVSTSFVFSATIDSTRLSIAAVTGSDNGILLDNIRLEEVEAILPSYLYPEEPLDVFKGEEALGDWTLEITDSRTGQPLSATGASLLEWNLEFLFAPPSVSATALTNGYLATNIVRGAEIRYFTVDVPSTAGAATNILTSLTGGQLNLLFNQNGRPSGTTPGDFYLRTATTNGTAVLTTNGIPPLQPGRRYYLGVQNTDPAETNSFTIQVFFDRLPGSPVNLPLLTNGFTLSTNIVQGTGVQYFAFDVSTNATGAAFEILSPSGDVNLVIRGGLPLPSPTSYDFRSDNLGTNYEYISVLTNSSASSLKPGRWYVGVYNVDVANVTYGLRVTEEYFFDPNVAGAPVTDVFPDVPLNLVAKPGSVVTNVYRLRITSSGEASALWELYNLAGDVDLLLARDYPPSLARHDLSSRKLGAGREEIVVQTDFLNPSLLGDWYVAVPNNATTNVSLTFRSAVSTNGIIPGAGTIMTNILADGVARTFKVGPGIVVTNYFLFATTGTPGAVLFEVYNADGNVDLVVGQGGIPSTTFSATSANSGLMDERVLIRTNSAITNLTYLLPNLTGNWLLATPNHQGTDVNFTIRATQTTPAGLIVSGEPLGLGYGMVDPVFGSLDFAIPTIPGEKYRFQSSPDLVTWTTVQTILATDYSFVVTVFPPMTGNEFYRVVQGGP